MESQKRGGGDQVKVIRESALPATTLSNGQDIFTQSGKEVQQELSPNIKHILIVDDDPDITLTFKKGLEAENEKGSNLFFEISIYNDPLDALSEFRPNLYDLLLVDINMPKIDGLEFSTKILEQDINVRVCFITATEINTRALRDQYPSLSIGCFIKKPVAMEKLVERVKAELN